MRNPQNGINRPCAIHSNEAVGAVPVCPPERPRSGVPIPKIHPLCAGILTMDAPLWGDTGGHTGTAPTTLRNIFPHNPIQTKFRPCAIHPKRNQPSHTSSTQTVSTATRNLPKRNCRGGACVPARTSAQRRFHTKKTRHYVRGITTIDHSKPHVVCPYPIGVILSIAQGWQVQRSLPWVTMQARRLPTTWVVLSFATRYYHARRTDDCPARKWI